MGTIMPKKSQQMNSKAGEDDERTRKEQLV